MNLKEGNASTHHFESDKQVKYSVVLIEGQIERTISIVVRAMFI